MYKCFIASSYLTSKIIHINLKSDILGQWKGDKTEVDHGTGFGECLVYYRAVSSVSAVVQHAIHTRVITSLEND